MRCSAIPLPETNFIMKKPLALLVIILFGFNSLFSQNIIVEPNTTHRLQYSNNGLIILDSLVLKEGATLVLDPNQATYRIQCNVFIVLQGASIIGKGGNGDDGDDGSGKGKSGKTGKSGINGASIEIKTNKFDYCDLRIDLRGGIGGDGGDGRKGSKGGNAECCVKSGGDGKPGGNAGNGGKGGNGGNFKLSYKVYGPSCSTNPTQIRRLITGGRGGKPGKAGSGGSGGNKSDKCFPGCNNPGGHKGPSGSKGSKGKTGSTGTFELIKY